MNLSTPCGLSTRLFTTVLFFIGFGLAHAQLNLPKTLDDPGVNPVMTIIWSDYSTSSGFLFGQRGGGEGSSGFNFVEGSVHSVTSNISFSNPASSWHSYNHFLLTYTDDTHSTPEPINIVADTIPITTNLQLQFTLDPFVAYQQEQYYPNELQPFRSYFGENVVLDFVPYGLINSPPNEHGTSGTPIVFSAAELAVLGDSDGHTLQLVQHGSSPALSTTIEIAPNADAQSIIDSIRVAAEPLAIYIEGAVADEQGSLFIYADEAIEIQDGSTPTASKTIDAPGRFPEVEYRFDSQDITITFGRGSNDSFTTGVNNNNNFYFQSFRSVYQGYYYLELHVDAEAPIRITPENASTINISNPATKDSIKVKFWVDPFAASDIPTALTSTPLQELFEGVDLISEDTTSERYINYNVASSDISRTEIIADVGTRGTAVSFTAEEITAIMAADSTSLAVVQTATGLRSTLTVPTDTDAQGLADHIQEAAIPFTVYIHEVVNDDGTLDIYADEAIEIHYTTANTASIAPLRKQGVLVYPNPVHAQLHLVYPSATPATYTVFDLTGKAHSTHHASGQTHQLHVSSLAKGVYLLKAQHGNQTGVFRFVKE